MTNEELMRPRAMVINPWPGSNAKVGDIWTGYLTGWTDQQGKEWREFDLLTAKELSARYPGNFRVLHWSEFRDVRDMPKYIKLGHSHVVKQVFNLRMQEDSWTYDNEKGHWAGCINKNTIAIFPATEEEYLLSKVREI